MNLRESKSWSSYKHFAKREYVSQEASSPVVQVPASAYSFHFYYCLLMKFSV